jgi:hypothetical protein
VIGDSDCSYDFFELHRVITPLAEGYDCVLGSRLAVTILLGAMPFPNRDLGNPVLTALLGLRTTAVPITYYPRLGPFMLRRWRDGLRHVRFMFSEAFSRQPRGTSAVTSSGPSPEVAGMNGNRVRFSERELIPSGPPETPRLSRPAVHASALGGQPPAARPEGP